MRVSTYRRTVCRLLLLPVVALFASCIDEDLSDCGEDYPIVYHVRLHTNVQTEIDAELTTAAESALGARLLAALANVFTDRVHDIDLSFYTLDSLRSHHENHIVDDNQASFTVYLPVRDYRHLALANYLDETSVGVLDNGRTSGLRLQQKPVADTVESHSRGLFTARRNLSVEESSQTFYVDLYMQNCAVALVLDPNGQAVNDIRGCLTGMADGFNLSDSLYTYAASAPVRMRPLADPVLHCLYGVCFPSREVPATRGAADEDALWQMRVYVTQADGKVTESVLSVRNPLRASTLRIIKARLDNNGGVVTEAPEVGVSVTLDWKPGGVYEPEI